MFLISGLISFSLFLIFGLEFALRIFCHRCIFFKKISNPVYYIIVFLLFALTLCFAYLDRLPKSTNDLTVVKIPAFLILAFCLVNTPIYINSYGSDYWKSDSQTRSKKIKRFITEAVLIFVVCACSCLMCETGATWQIVSVMAVTLPLLLYRCIRYTVWFIRNKY